MSEKKPKVSVIMPCYNHEKYVGQAIESVLNQTYKDFEFIIMDNGCTDGSYEIIESYAKADKRIKVLRLKENNPCESMHQMMKYVQGEYTAMMYSDDFWCKTKLEKQIDCVTQLGYKVCGTWAQFTNEDLIPLEGNSVFIKENRTRAEWIKILLEKGNCFSACSAFAETELFKKSIGKIFGYWQLPDYYGWLVLLLETDVYLVEEVLVLQRFHGGNNANISTPSMENQIRAMSEKGIIFVDVIDKLDDQLFSEIFLDGKTGLSHIEIIAEKLIFLLEQMKNDWTIEQTVIELFFRYYSYEEDNVSVSEVLSNKYDYTYLHFKDITSSNGIVARILNYEMKLKEQNENSHDKEIIISFILVNLNEVVLELSKNNSDNNIFNKLIFILEEMLEIWDWLILKQVKINREEIELCIRVAEVCALNEQHIQIEQMLTFLKRYIIEIEKIID